VAHIFDKTTSFQSFWDVFGVEFLILFTSSLIVKMIQEKHLRIALLLTSFELFGVTVTVGSKKIG